MFIDFGVGNGIDGKNVINQKIYLGGDNHFYASFDISGYETVQALRFDPADTYISMKIDAVKIDGVDVEWKPCNICRHDGEKDVFYTNDPQYTIDIGVHKESIVEIFGVVYGVGELVANMELLEVKNTCKELRQELISIQKSRWYKISEQFRKLRSCFHICCI